MQLEQTRGDGADNGGGQRRGDPDADIADDVAHLQHTGADALGHQTAPAVLPEAHDGESYHLGAAARYGSAARQTRQSQTGADGGGGDGQRQRHADDDGHQNAHEEGL